MGAKFGLHLLSRAYIKLPFAIKMQRLGDHQNVATITRSEICVATRTRFGGVSRKYYI